jgi:hypothetical protein
VLCVTNSAPPSFRMFVARPTVRKRWVDMFASNYQRGSDGRAISPRSPKNSPRNRSRCVSQLTLKSQDTYEVDVTGCRYAQFYKELGEPELGFLLACGQDFSFAEGLGSGIKLTRIQTIMQGASHCDFRNRRQKD